MVGWFAVEVVPDQCRVSQGVNGKTETVALHANRPDHLFIGTQVVVLVVIDLYHRFPIDDVLRSRHMTGGTADGLLHRNGTGDGLG